MRMDVCSDSTVYKVKFKQSAKCGERDKFKKRIRSERCTRKVSCNNNIHPNLSTIVSIF